MIRGTNVVLDVHVVVLVVFLQHERVRFQAALQLLRALLVHVALTGNVRGSLQISGRLPFVLCLPQLLLVLHPPVLEPRFYLRRVNMLRY